MLCNKSGSVLILSFWALIILSLLAYGVTRRVNAQIALARHQMGKVQSKYAAYAGLFYSIERLREDLNDPRTREYDTLYECGLSERRAPEESWKGTTGHGSFYVARGHRQDQPGLSDETGRINLNGLNEQNYHILTELLKILDVGERDAEEIASGVLDWKDGDSSVFSTGAEQDYYQNLSEAYDCKNRPLESMSELRLVKGVTPEIFEKIHPYVTVYPFIGPLKINFNTAPEAVLKAVARSVAGIGTNTNQTDADEIAEQIIKERCGSDGEWGTDDDVPVFFGLISFSATKIPIATALASFESRRAMVVRADIVGVDESGRVSSALTAFIDTSVMGILSLRVN
ncbi:MAG: general secretion pathway protein GspK [Candidatus Omnitrophota bacterium]